MITAKRIDDLIERIESKFWEQYKLLKKQIMYKISNGIIEVGMIECPEDAVTRATELIFTGRMKEAIIYLNNIPIIGVTKECIKYYDYKNKIKMGNKKILVLQEGECNLFDNFEKAKNFGKEILKEKDQTLRMYIVSEYGEMDKNGVYIYDAFKQ